MTNTRRNFLKAGWRYCTGLLAVAAGWTTWELLRPLRASGASGKFKVGNPSEFADGTATYNSAGRLWIANTGGHLFALSQKCPHLGCRVPFCESSGQFECPCHGSVFDIAGEHVTGPSPRGMDQYALSIENGELFVDLDAKTDGPPPGTRNFYTPAKGPSCKGQG